MKRLMHFLLLLSFIISSKAQPSYPMNPSDAQLIATDLDNFLKAFEQLDESSDTIAILTTHYFDKASPGMIEYMNRHGLTVSSLSKSIQKYPQQYRTLKEFQLGIDSFTKAFEKEMAAYKNVVSDAMFPPTYLIVGTNKGIAQASPKGQLITIERVSDEPEKLIQVISHELTHFQQARALGFQNYIKTYSKPDNMLELILREGGAEFVSYYLVGKNKRSYRNKSYFETNEQSLKERFLKDLENKDQTYWLWESLKQEEGPTLLGYTIGYKICESYYKQAVDKNQALLDILAISDDQSFLKVSRYFEASNQ
ncbi:DUF2268 domain-containing putative Zn-dependent protease [Ekhidna sp.]|uniref:DUF2268 domain-containing putative Zn-dependent protease n=1 Tax=Ekhidna sp. TaxID=2608089 RepID=UPI003CCC1A39